MKTDSPPSVKSPLRVTLLSQWRTLIFEDQPLKRRILLVLPAICLPVLTVFLFGPVEMFRQNQEVLEFTVDSVLLVFLPLAIAAIVALTALLLLCRGGC